MIITTNSKKEDIPAQFKRVLIATAVTCHISLCPAVQRDDDG